MTNLENNDSIDLRRLFREIARYKKLYVIAAIFFIGLGVFYCFYKMPQYKSSSTILIEDSASGGSSGMGGAGGMSNIMKTFSLGGFTSSSVDNEILILESNQIVNSVVNKLGLNISYIRKDGIKRDMLYKDSPIRIELSEGFLSKMKKGIRLNVKLSGGKADIKVSTGFMGLSTLDNIKDTNLPVKIGTEYGEIFVMKTDLYSDNTDETIEVRINDIAGTANGLKKMVDIDFCDKLADAISLEIKYPNRELGESIINTYMAEYNNVRRLRRKNNSDEEARFLESRISELLPQLISIEGEIEEFKKKHNIAGIGEEAQILVKSSVEGEKELIRTKFAKNYYNDVLAKLNNGDIQLIPIIEGIGNPMIKDYNELVMEHSNLAREVKPGNKRIKQLTDNISLMRSSLLDNIHAALDTIQMRENVIQQLRVKAESKLNELPTTERGYYNLVRDNQMKNELYSFLIQKRENALLQASATDTLGFIIDPAYSEEKPDLTKAMVVLVICLLLSIICPTLVALTFFIFKNGTIDNLMDVNFAGIEDNSILYTGQKTELGLLRNKLLSDSKSAVTLMINFAPVADAKAITGELIESISSIDKCSATADVPVDSLGNDTLLKPDFESAVSNLAESNNIVFVEVPENDHVENIIPFIEKMKAQILFIIPVPRIVKRATIMNIVKKLPDGTKILACLDAKPE